MNVTNSKEWVDRLVSILFEPEMRMLDRMIVELNNENSSLKRTQFYGFMHMGQRFIPREFMQHAHMLARNRIPCPALAFGLMDKAAELVQQKNRIDLDRRQISQVLFSLISPCCDLQELRDSLPECLVALVPDLSRLKRDIQDPLWLVRSNPYTVNDFNKILPKIEFYAMTRMMY